MRIKSLKSLAYALSPSAAHPLLERIEGSAIGSRLARGLFWSISGTIISRVLMLCASILVARVLGKAVFGELGMFQSTVGMLGAFAGFGLGLTATKHVAELRQHDPRRAGRIIALSGLFALIAGSLIAILLFIFAPWLAINTINAPELAGILRIGAVMLFLNAINGAQIGALCGFEAFKTIAQVNLFVGIFSCPVLIAGAYLGGLSGTAWALSINFVFNWLLNHFALRREAKRHKVPLTLQGCWQERSILWKFSLPAALGDILVSPINWACAALLVNQPYGYEEMGIFNAANQWFSAFAVLPTILGAVILPILSEKIGKKDTEHSAKTLILITKLNIIILTPLVLIVGLASPYIMGLYGKEFVHGWPTLVVTTLTAALFAIQAPIGHVIAASGRMWLGLTMNLGWGIVLLICAYIFLHFGAIGLASARLLSYIVHATWTFGFAFFLIRNQSQQNLSARRGPDANGS